MANLQLQNKKKSPKPKEEPTPKDELNNQNATEETTVKKGEALGDNNSIISHLVTIHHIYYPLVPRVVSAIQNHPHRTSPYSTYRELPH